MPAKHSAIPNHRPVSQRGAALMVMLVIIIIGITALLANSLTASKVNNARQATTASALAQAKDALIGYAITYGDTHSNTVPGYLPCPDLNGTAGTPPSEGSSNTCGNKDINSIGRLPWKTLGLGPLRDGKSECLWYVVSGTYKNNPNTDMMNWDTIAKLQTYAPDGTQLSSEVVAVVFSPGPALTGQDRSAPVTNPAPECGGNYTASNYLDNDAAHGINNTNIATGKFIQGVSGSSTVNDQMLFITKQDLWDAAQKRSDFQAKMAQLTNEVTKCIAKYGTTNDVGNNYSLPWPAPVDLGAIANYAVNAKYDDVSGLYAGRVPYTVNQSRVDSGNQRQTLMTNYDCGPTWTTSLVPWWNNWKDHLFYALAKEFRPQHDTNQSCGSNDCAQINGSGQYAGVVMFAGAKLSGQTRASKNALADYLETPNNTNFSGANGKEDYKTAPASGTFNDMLYCIKEDLSVIPCP